jgi:hypothetical protein
LSQACQPVSCARERSQSGVLPWKRLPVALFRRALGSKSRKRGSQAFTQLAPNIGIRWMPSARAPSQAREARVAAKLRFGRYSPYCQ